MVYCNTKLVSALTPVPHYRSSTFVSFCLHAGTVQACTCYFKGCQLNFLCLTPGFNGTYFANFSLDHLQFWLLGYVRLWGWEGTAPQLHLSDMEPSTNRNLPHRFVNKQPTIKVASILFFQYKVLSDHKPLRPVSHNMSTLLSLARPLTTGCTHALLSNRIFLPHANNNWSSLIQDLISSTIAELAMLTWLEFYFRIILRVLCEVSFHLVCLHLFCNSLLDDLACHTENISSHWPERQFQALCPCPLHLKHCTDPQSLNLAFWNAVISHSSQNWSAILAHSSLDNFE